MLFTLTLTRARSVTRLRRLDAAPEFRLFELVWRIKRHDVDTGMPGPSLDQPGLRGCMGVSLLNYFAVEFNSVVEIFNGSEPQDACYFTADDGFRR